MGILSLRPRSLCGLGLLSAAIISVSTRPVVAQGCVAIRGTGMDHMEQFAMTADADLTSGEWLASVGFRWFQSDRHFVGDVDQHRDDIGNQVINDSYFWDLSMQYAFTPRGSISLTIPFVYSTRSSLYEHNRVNRYSSSAGGIGDIQLMPAVWLWDPSKMPKGNIQIGIGMSAPSGDYQATDTFISAAGPVTGYVDQSIQPGTGGWGIVNSVVAFRELLPRLTGFVNGVYLMNPGDVNGTPTTTGTSRRNPYEQVMSIPDQYFGQGGFMYTVVPKWGLALGVGARIDGVPAEDVFGDSNGFRRPGYAISVEPLLQWSHGRFTFSVAVPIAVYRNRTQSVADERWTADTGIYRHGDAAFADISVISNLAASF